MCRAGQAKALLAAGADIHAGDGLGMRSLHATAVAPNLRSLRALLDAGAGVNLRGSLFVHSEDERGDVTPLHMAATGGAPEVAELLPERGVEVNAMTYTTPLDDAVR